MTGRLVLAVHRLADRLDLLPSEFDAESRIDRNDATAVLAEWIRYARFWASYNPEEMFALKVGGAMLLAGVLALWLAIAFFL
ncbi:MAG TPA: hypothetical protein VJS38_16455 [Phenylobacterium sp.]|uniref:hypothetical protein n=1 Tax=Phenylobacterium sp. TaxID=1871053 RepID=UPI002B4813BC|nr:hypothetical protein [Phenylobacterium sp.]HKR89764.1 hypothetical protein [Phenylobacterium sp.]